MSEITLLRKNIDKYMELKGYKYYTDLLYIIGLKLGLEGDELDSFPDKEKNNFSKMLNGERPLKYTFIIPLEEIFGVPLAKLLNDNSYFPAIDKENIQFLNGFRYYAHIDDFNKYNELFKMGTVDGERIICNTDEYNKFLMDYLIEYRAYNGLSYLVKNHNLKYDVLTNCYYIDKNKILDANLPLQISRFIIDSNDVDLFNKVYNTFDCYILYYPYSDADFLYNKKEFVNALINNTNIFNIIFDKKTYDFDVVNQGVNPLDGIKKGVTFINPIINIVLNYCLSNLDKYNKQAKYILQFGIEYNNNFFKNLQYPCGDYYFNNIGIVIAKGGRRILGNIIYINQSTNDDEINGLISKLTKI